MSLASMGNDIADINNDGFPDIFTTEMLPSEDTRLKSTTKFDDFTIHNEKIKKGFHYQFMQNSLQLNGQQGYYSEIAHLQIIISLLFVRQI